MVPPVPQPPAPPPPPSHRPQRAETLGSQAAAAANAAAAFYRGWRTGKTPSDPLDMERQRQASRYYQALTQYKSQANALRARLVAGSVCVVGGVLMAAQGRDAPLVGPPILVLGGGTVVYGVWQAVKGRRGLHTLSPPEPPLPIAPVPPALPPGTASAAQAGRVTQLRLHIVELLPSVEMLHPQAADDIRAADAATAPGLNAVVERIRSMQRIIEQMPGSTAAASAQISIDALTIRLTEGANAYQELLTAVVTLSTAPSIAGGPAQTLRPAITDMHAYAAGLDAAARTWV